MRYLYNLILVLLTVVSFAQTPGTSRKAWNDRLKIKSKAGTSYVDVTSLLNTFKNEVDSITTDGDTLKFWQAGSVVGKASAGGLDDLTASNGIVFIHSGRDFGQKIVKDTTTLKAYSPDSVGTTIYLKQSNLQGYFSYIDSAYAADTYNVFDVSGPYQWLRIDNEPYLNTAEQGLTFGTNISTKLQAIVDAAYTFNKPMVYIPKFAGTGGVYTVDTSITVPLGIRLVGQGTADYSHDGTVLQLADNANCRLISTVPGEDYIWGSVENMRLLGNSANNTSGTGIFINNFGETCYLRNLVISDFVDECIKIGGTISAPAHLENVSLFSSKNGLNIDAAGTVYIETVSGDNNDSSLVRINTTGTVIINQIKAESTDSSYHKAVIWLDSCDVSATIIINNIYANGGSGSRATNGSALIRITGTGASQTPRVIVRGWKQSGYNYLILNEATNDTIPLGLSTRMAGIEYNADVIKWGVNTLMKRNNGFQFATTAIPSSSSDFRTVFTVLSDGITYLRANASAGIKFQASDTTDVGLITGSGGLYLYKGLRVGHASKIDTMAVDADSLYIFRNGGAWKSIPLNNSDGP